MHARGPARMGHVPKLPMDRRAGQAAYGVPTNNLVSPQTPSLVASEPPPNTSLLNSTTPLTFGIAGGAPVEYDTFHNEKSEVFQQYPEAYSSVMQEADIVHDERLIESCHHIHIKSIPKSLWVFLVALLGVACANLALLIVLVAR